MMRDHKLPQTIGHAFQKYSLLQIAAFRTFLENKIGLKWNVRCMKFHSDLIFVDPSGLNDTRILNLFNFFFLLLGYCRFCRFCVCMTQTSNNIVYVKQWYRRRQQPKNLWKTKPKIWNYENQKIYGKWLDERGLLLGDL